MDDAVLELLSRYLDDDLSPAEARVLEARLAGDPALRLELDALISMQRAVAELAERESAPQRLDALVEPLRRARARRPAVRPAFRWLAAAASVALAVVASVHVMRSPDTMVGAEGVERRRVFEPPARRATPFQLQPLPSVSEDEEVLSAADRVLAEPIPDPPLVPPPALDVLGPLPEQGKPAVEELRQVGAAAGGGGARLPSEATPVLSPGVRARRAEADASSMKAGESPAGVAQSARAACTARLTIDGPTGVVEIEMAGPMDWAVGSHRVRVRVVEGRVRWLEPSRPEPVSELESQVAGISSRRAVSLPAPGLPDGEYPAELVVEGSR